MPMIDDFATWLEHEMVERGLSQSELARRGGLTPTAINKVLSRERRPGVDLCRGIARAFNMQDVDVMRLAGLAAPDPSTDAPGLRELISRFSQLSDEDQEAVLRHVRALDEMQQAEKRRSLRLKPKVG